MSLSASCVKGEAQSTGGGAAKGRETVPVKRRIARAGRPTILGLGLAPLDPGAFFPPVELHRRPDLRGRPLVVGGDPHGRGVVATASYEARKFGIRSAMSSAEALRRCPDVVFVRPDHREYRDWSRRVWGLVGELAPVV